MYLPLERKTFLPLERKRYLRLERKMDMCLPQERNVYILASGKKDCLW